MGQPKKTSAQTIAIDLAQAWPPHRTKQYAVNDSENIISEKKHHVLWISVNENDGYEMKCWNASSVTLLHKRSKYDYINYPVRCNATHISSEWPFIGVCRATHLSTLSTAASLWLMLPVASSSTPQVAISSSCHDIVAPSSVVGCFLSWARQPGTHCQRLSLWPVI